MRIRLGGPPAYWFLSRFFRVSNRANQSRGSHLPNYISRIIEVVGSDRWQSIQRMRIVDFGCGYGEGAIELAQVGAKCVVGFDIRPSLLEHGRKNAKEAGVSSRCTFTDELPDDSADFIVSVDAFEHFASPKRVLESMATVLVSGGQVITSFGPTWYHPRGGHIFSPFPWAHLIFSEASLCRWRQKFCDDGATQFFEVEGGLNQMTISHFEQLVDDSPFKVESLVAKPIGKLKILHNRWTREYLTSVINCVLTKH